MARAVALIGLAVVALCWIAPAWAASPWDGEWEGEVRSSRQICSPCRVRLTVKDGIPDIRGDVSMPDFKIADSGKVSGLMVISVPGYKVDCALHGQIAGDILKAMGQCTGSGEPPEVTLRRISGGGLVSAPPPAGPAPARPPSTQTVPPQTELREVAPGQATRQPTAAQRAFGQGTQPLRLVDLTYDIPEGASIGQLQTGSWLTSCGAGKTVPLTRKSFRQPDLDAFQTVFSYVAQSRGYKLGGRIQSKELTAATYLVNARVTAMNWVSCVRENSKPPQWSGSGSMSIAWQVMRASDGQVVYSTTTRTDSTLPSGERRTDGLLYLFVTTFGDAVLQLVSTPGFRDAVREATAGDRPRIGGADAALLRSPPPFRGGITANMKSILPGVVEIRTPAGAGSGFVVDAAGLILTNAHVVRGTDAVTVGFSDGGTAPGTVVKRDLGRDVALVRVDRKGLRALPIRHGEPILTEKVYAIGSPLGLSQTVTEGIVSSYRRQENGLDMIQATPAISPGNSGGPLLDANGNVVGISMLFSVEARSLNFFIPIDSALSFLNLRSSGR